MVIRMKIVVINGSPKGNKLSITMQLVHYAQKLFPNHEFKLINVSQKLTRMKIKEETFQEILKEISTADGVLWGFPVYLMLIPAQLKKFIELLFENNAQEILKGKYSAVLSTSMNFLDNLAFDYMHAIIEDLNMKDVRFFSSTMFDFSKIERRKMWYLFIENFLNTIEKKLPIPRRFKSLTYRKDFIFTPSEVPANLKLDTIGKKIILVTDNTEEGSNLGKMIQKFKDSFRDGIEIYNINNIDMKAGCMSCLRCAHDNQCIQQDGFFEFFQKKFKNNDIIVYALSIKDRYFSYLFKQFIDRGFFNGHTPIFEGVQLCYILSGPLSQLDILRQSITAHAELGWGNIVDIITDEFGESEDLNELIYNMAKKSIEFSKSGYIQPPTFINIGGYKIFRDMIYGLPGVAFQADYRFYKKRGMFDFPKNKLSSRMLRLVLKSKNARKWFDKNFLEIGIRPYNKFFKNLDVDEEKAKLRLQKY